MSLTFGLWLAAFAVLALLALFRPVWGVSLYMLTFFACPPFWWWGNDHLGYRWNLYGGVGLLIAVILSRTFGSPKDVAERKSERMRLMWIAIAILVNAGFVHVALAVDPESSADGLFLLAKFVLLFFMITIAVQTRADYRILLLTFVMGAGYIGYECTINDRGRVEAGRLEGIGAPGARGANQFASLMVTVMPVIGALLLVGRPWEKVLSFVVTPMVLNVILLCNSRGAFLAAIVSAGAFLVCAPKGLRKRAVQLLCLGAIATWLLMGDAKISERFLSIFVSAEERDGSASSRLEFWAAGLRAVADHPLGAGGNGFKRGRSLVYIGEGKSVHNGFINEAAEWGVQGLALKLLFLGCGVLLLWRSIRHSVARNDNYAALTGCGIIAGLVGFLSTCMFGDFLDAEWGYWFLAISIVHARIVLSPVSLASGASHTAAPSYPTTTIPEPVYS